MRVPWWGRGLLLGGAVSAALGVTSVVVRRPLPTPTAALVGDAVWAPGAVPAPEIALRDQRGRVVRLSALRGRVVAVTFMDSRCTTDCPVEGAVLAALQRRLGPAAPLTLLVVSTDPGGDTPARARAFARRYGWTGPWDWLLGSRRQLAPVWRAYHVRVQSADGHSDAIYLVGPGGDERAAFGFPYSVPLLLADVRALSRHRTVGWTWPLGG